VAYRIRQYAHPICSCHCSVALANAVRQLLSVSHPKPTSSVTNVGLRRRGQRNCIPNPQGLLAHFFLWLRPACFDVGFQVFAQPQKLEKFKFCCATMLIEERVILNDVYTPIGAIRMSCSSSYCPKLTATLSRFNRRRGSVLNQGKTSTGLATELLVNVVFQLVS
jgi:hypothetical protein